MEIYQSRLSSLIKWTLVILSYLFIEWVYNQHLLAVISIRSLDLDHFYLTEAFGKCVASIGVNLVIFKLVNYKGVSKFIIGFFLAYGLLTVLFNYAINSFPRDVQYASFYSMQYRQDVLEGKDADKLLAFVSADAGAASDASKPWFNRPLVLSYFFLVLDSDYWRSSEQSFKSSINKRFDQATLNKSKNKGYWIKYQKLQKFNQALPDLEERYRLADNIRVQRQMSDADFLKKTGFQPSLHGDALDEAIAKKYGTDLSKPIIPENKDLGIEAVHARDIPENMNKDMFMSYLHSKATDIRDQVSPAIGIIKDNKKSVDALSLLVIPPISLSLSLFSIVLNLTLLAWQWIQLIAEMVTKKPFEFIYHRYSIAVAFIAVIFLTGYLVESKATILSLDSKWLALQENHGSKHPMLSALENFTLRLEPVICFTINQPSTADWVTKKIYGMT